MAEPIIWREPESFAAGDTLVFRRYFADFQADAGWSLEYVISGAVTPISFISAADGTVHVITVAAADTAGWLPGSYTLAGYAVNGAERHQIYEGPLTILPNLPQQAGDVDTRTFAEKMVAKYEALLLQIADSNLTQSHVGETRFSYEAQEKIRTEHGYWTQVRSQEVAMARAREGRPTGRKIKPVMHVMSPGPAIGQQFVGGYKGW